jgi:hypothetical protein
MFSNTEKFLSAEETHAVFLILCKNGRRPIFAQDKSGL